MGCVIQALKAEGRGMGEHPTPTESQRYDEATGALTVSTVSPWTDFGTAGGYRTLTRPGNGTLTKLGINTAADTTNRLALKFNAALFSHDDVTPGTGDMRIVLN